MAWRPPPSSLLLSLLLLLLSALQPSSFARAIADEADAAQGPQAEECSLLQGPRPGSRRGPAGPDEETAPELLAVAAPSLAPTPSHLPSQDVAGEIERLLDGDEADETATAEDVISAFQDDAAAIAGIVKDPSLANAVELVQAVGSTLGLIGGPTGLVLSTVFCVGGLFMSYFVDSPSQPSVADLFKAFENRIGKHLEVIQESITNLASVMTTIVDKVIDISEWTTLGGDERAKTDSLYRQILSQTQDAATSTGKDQEMGWNDVNASYASYRGIVEPYLTQQNVFANTTLRTLLSQSLERSTGSPWQAAMSYQDFLASRVKAWHLVSTYYTNKEGAQNPHAERLMTDLVDDIEGYRYVTDYGVSWTGTKEKYTGLYHNIKLDFHLSDIVNWTRSKLARCNVRNAQFEADLAGTKTPGDENDCEDRRLRMVLSNENSRALAETCGQAGRYLVDKATEQWGHAPWYRVQLFFIHQASAGYVTDCNPGYYKHVSDGWRSWLPSQYTNIHFGDATNGGNGAIVVYMSSDPDKKYEGKVLGLDTNHPRAELWEELYQGLPTGIRTPIVRDGAGGAVAWGGRKARLWHYTRQSWSGGNTEDWGEYFDKIHLMASNDNGGAFVFNDNGLWNLYSTNYDKPTNWGGRLCTTENLPVDGPVKQVMVEDGASGVWLIDYTCDGKAVLQRWERGQGRIESGQIAVSASVPALNSGGTIVALAPHIVNGYDPDLDKFYAVSDKGFMYMFHVERAGSTSEYTLTAQELPQGKGCGVPSAFFHSDNNGGVFFTCHGYTGLWHIWGGESTKAYHWTQQ